MIPRYRSDDRVLLSFVGGQSCVRPESSFDIHTVFVRNATVRSEREYPSNLQLSEPLKILLYGAWITNKYIQSLSDMTDMASLGADTSAFGVDYYSNVIGIMNSLTICR